MARVGSPVGAGVDWLLGKLKPLVELAPELERLGPHYEGHSWSGDLVFGSILSRVYGFLSGFPSRLCSSFRFNGLHPKSLRPETSSPLGRGVQSSSARTGEQGYFKAVSYTHLTLPTNREV